MARRASTAYTYGLNVEHVFKWAETTGQAMPLAPVALQFWVCHRLEQVQAQTVTKELSAYNTWAKNFGIPAIFAAEHKALVSELHTALRQLASAPLQATAFSANQVDCMLSSINTDTRAGARKA